MRSVDSQTVGFFWAGRVQIVEGVFARVHERVAGERRGGAAFERHFGEQGCGFRFVGECEGEEGGRFVDAENVGEVGILRFDCEREEGNGGDTVDDTMLVMLVRLTEWSTYTARTDPATHARCTMQ